jgi:hypothetical protein
VRRRATGAAGSLGAAARLRQLVALDLVTCNRRDLCDAPSHFFFERIGARNLMLWAVTRARLRAWCLVNTHPLPNYAFPDKLCELPPVPEGLLDNDPELMPLGCLPAEQPLWMVCLMQHQHAATGVVAPMYDARVSLQVCVHAR